MESATDNDKKVSSPQVYNFFGENVVKNRYERIRVLMADRGIASISDLAREVGISRSQMSQIMHEHFEPSLDLRLKIAGALKTDSFLIFGDSK
tara:strand:+ start:766 stop:1044 length:279 start_codon:yes stop_codon:yes gene_type:complete